jgi:hypothetical protein
MYEFVGKASPFLVLATLGLFDGCKYSTFSSLLNNSEFYLIISITINCITTCCIR